MCYHIEQRLEPYRKPNKKQTNKTLNKLNGVKMDSRKEVKI